jgi:hypothetical protein
MQAYRDSEGRQREEFYQVLGPAGAEEKFLSNVIISNPVECVVYNLDVAHHVARRRTFSSDATDATGQSKVPAGLEHRALPEELRPKTSVEHLGADSIEGLAVEGLRTSTTFPVGSQGNDRPIVAIYEIWTSPQLKVPVLERTSDPRSGERTTRLRNIDLVEPSAELFRVPADYQIQDEHQ